METTLDRSSLIVVEFFEYCVNSILYQRGVYPREDFEVERKIGMPLLITNNDELKVYVDQIMSQVRVWLQKGKLSSLIVVIKSKDTGDILERWQFNIEPHLEQQQQTLDNDGELTNDTKAQIRAIMRQISASVTFLPELDTDDVTFAILVHTDHDVDVPTAWGDTDPKLIKGGGEHVRLKHMETSKHKITPIVAYRVTDDD
ncbi:DNA-binding protein [Phascolomyces articulosus]|uniref:DNA-binding protein n=1 Tax=Phascolomyces articulosus TaxID=60185 RepID=A0AAD5JUI5_9FUNG|nr:DNA-binding protein [Phascolomyces articulosus]